MISGAWAERGLVLVPTGGGGFASVQDYLKNLEARTQVFFMVRTQVSGIEIKRRWIVLTESLDVTLTQEKRCQQIK